MDPSHLGLSFGKILVQEILHCSHQPVSRSIKSHHWKEEKPRFNVTLNGQSPWTVSKEEVSKM